MAGRNSDWISLDHLEGNGTKLQGEWHPNARGMAPNCKGNGTHGWPQFRLAGRNSDWISRDRQGNGASCIAIQTESALRAMAHDEAAWPLHRRCIAIPSGRGNGTQLQGEWHPWLARNSD